MSNRSLTPCARCTHPRSRHIDADWCRSCSCEWFVPEIDTGARLVADFGWTPPEIKPEPKVSGGLITSDRLEPKPAANNDYRADTERH